MKRLVMTLVMIFAAAGLYASEAERVLTKYGYNPGKVDYEKVRELTSVPRGFGSIETADTTINTKYEAAIALVWNDKNWVATILLLKEMQRVMPERADEFQKNIDSVKKNKSVTDTQIVDAYKAQLMEFSKGNKYFTFYVTGTKKINPEMQVVLDYLTCSPAERPGKEKKVLDMGVKILAEFKKSPNEDSVAAKKAKEFCKLSLAYPEFYYKLNEAYLDRN